jgi:hypothetical protein
LETAGHAKILVTAPSATLVIDPLVESLAIVDLSVNSVTAGLVVTSATALSAILVKIAARVATLVIDLLVVSSVIVLPAKSLAIADPSATLVTVAHAAISVIGLLAVSLVIVLPAVLKVVKTVPSAILAMPTAPKASFAGVLTTTALEEVSARIPFLKKKQRTQEGKDPITTKAEAAISIATKSR